MTNGDEIRQMSDEELSERLSCPHYDWGNICQKANDADCGQCILDWLKSKESGKADAQTQL